MHYAAQKEGKAMYERLGVEVQSEQYEFAREIFAVVQERYGTGYPEHEPGMYGNLPYHNLAHAKDVANSAL